MSFMWAFLAAKFALAILTCVFNVEHQGAAALHVVLYNWVASTFHKFILGLAKSWAEGQLCSCNVLFHKQSYYLFHLLTCDPHSHLPLTAWFWSFSTHHLQQLIRGAVADGFLASKELPSVISLPNFVHCWQEFDCFSCSPLIFCCPVGQTKVGK